MNGSLSGPLRKGLKNDSRVQILQTVLREAGYYSGVSDGSYGPMTRMAVMNFQTSQGLSSDGTWGPRTLLALQNFVNLSTQSLGTATANPVQAPAPVTINTSPVIQQQQPSGCGSSSIRAFSIDSSTIDITNLTQSQGTTSIRWSACNVLGNPVLKLIPGALDTYQGTIMDGQTLVQQGKIPNPIILSASGNSSAGYGILGFDSQYIPAGNYMFTATWNLNGSNVERSVNIRINNQSFRPTNFCSFSEQKLPTYQHSVKQGADEPIGSVRLTVDCVVPTKISRVTGNVSGTGAPFSVTMEPKLYLNNSWYSFSPVYAASDPSFAGTYDFSGSSQFTIPSGTTDVELSFRADTVRTTQSAGTPVGSSFQLFINSGNVVIKDNSGAILQPKNVQYPITTGAQVTIIN